MWNIPFDGLGVAGVAGWEAVSAGKFQTPTRVGPCLTTDKLLADERWEVMVRELMLEVIRTGNALGCSLSETLADKNIERTRTMGAYKASTLIDFELGRPLELGSLFLEPLRRAAEAGMSVPRLKALCLVLQKLCSAQRQIS